MCIITVVAAVGHVDDINKGKKGEIKSKVNRQHGDGAINTLTSIFLSFIPLCSIIKIIFIAVWLKCLNFLHFYTYRPLL